LILGCSTSHHKAENETLYDSYADSLLKYPDNVESFIAMLERPDADSIKTVLNDVSRLDYPNFLSKYVTNSADEDAIIEELAKQLKFINLFNTVLSKSRENGTFGHDDEADMKELLFYAHIMESEDTTWTDVEIQNLRLRKKVTFRRLHVPLSWTAEYYRKIKIEDENGDITEIKMSDNSGGRTNIELYLLNTEAKVQIPGPLEVVQRSSNQCQVCERSVSQAPGFL